MLCPYRYICTGSLHPHTTSLTPFVDRVDGDSLVSIGAVYILETLKSYLNNSSHLDVGCWTGGFFFLCQVITKKSIGLELQLQPLLIAKKHNPKGLFLSGSVFAIPFQDSYFDIVTLVDVIEHLPKNTEVSALQEISRVLCSERKLFLTTPNMHPMGICADPAYFLTGHRHYSIRRLKKMLELSGFEIVFLLHLGGFFSACNAFFSSICKHLLKRKFSTPAWLNYLIKKEYRYDKSWWTSTRLAILAKKIK